MSAGSGLAGPVSNLLLALIFTLGLLAVVLFLPGGGGLDFWQGSYFQLFKYGIRNNLILAFFNLIPIPPLDGSHILGNLLPRDAARSYERLRPYGFIILLAAVYFNLLTIFFLPARMLFTRLMKFVLLISSAAM